MAKKKKGASSANPRTYSTIYKSDNTVPEQKKGSTAKAAASTGTKTAVVEPKSSDQVNWQSEYAYVFGDLRLLAIVSVVLFALIIGAGFVL